MISLADLLVPQTRQDAETALYAAFADLGLPVTGWKQGSWIRTIVTCFATVLAAVLAMQNRIVRAGFREYVLDRDWAVLGAQQVYGYTPREATFAAGALTITNTGGAVYTDVQPGDLVVSYPDAGATYRNTEVWSIGIGETVSVACEALEAGSASSAPIGAVDTLVTAMLGLTVTNATAWVGLDAETIAEINAACDDALDALSPSGAAGAYAARARSAVRAADGSAIGVTRTRATVGSGTGEVTLYCAAGASEVAGTAGDPTTDLGAVQLALGAVTPLGVTATAASARATPLDVEYTAVYTIGGATLAERELAIELALAEWLAQEPIGGRSVGGDSYLYADAILAVIRGATPGCITASLTTPAADIAMPIEAMHVLDTVTPHTSEVAA
jgi:hypothetical protein